MLIIIKILTLITIVIEIAHNYKDNNTDNNCIIEIAHNYNNNNNSSRYYQKNNGRHAPIVIPFIMYPHCITKHTMAGSLVV